MALNTQNETLRTIGNWSLLEKIGDSGMGKLYRARNRNGGDVVAVKVLPPFQAGNFQAYQRFARECRILTALHDPHIVRALDFGIDGSDPYLVMEFVEGERLSERIERAGGLPEAEAVGLITQVAGALGRIHSRRLVHRNVKPESILITSDGQAKLTDLGLAKDVDSQEGLTRDGASLGTPNYMAPEQFRNAAKATRRCDIYSLAATLYMALTGEPPFAGCNLVEMCTRKLRNDQAGPQERVPAVSNLTDRAIRRAMSAQPDLRPATCDEFVASLSGANESEAAVGTIETAIEPTAGDVLLPDAPSVADPMADAGDTEPTEAPWYAKASSWLWLAAGVLIAASMPGIYLLSRLVHFGR
jgi:eukaryotic-like serine/threonine-protein kinase